jgi:hypothetical protein
MMEQVDLPEMEKGDWRIDQFTLTGKEFQRWGSRHVPPGTYTRLRRGGTLVMSDTPNEMSDHYDIVREATGKVLLNGLGLGMVLKNVLLKEEVTEVTVVEVDPDLIQLVGPYYDDKRVTILCADALTFKPPKGKRYNAVWHDIWDDICIDNLEEMGTLHRKYGRRTDWQGSWCRGLCELHRDREKREQNMWFRGWHRD